MSSKLIGAVWQLDLPPETKFLLLCYVYFANAEGHNVFPSVSRLAKMGGFTERGVQKITRRLEAAGYLVADGSGPKRTRRWIVSLDTPNQVHPEPRAPRTKGRSKGEPRAPELKNLSKNVLKTSGGPKNGRLPDGLFDAITDTTQTDPKTAGSSIAKVAYALAKANYTAADVLAFKKWWWGTKNMRQRPPSVWELQEKIGVVRQSKTMTKPDEPHEYFVPPNMRSDYYDRPPAAIPSDSGDPKPPGF